MIPKNNFNLVFLFFLCLATSLFAPSLTKAAYLDGDFNKDNKVDALDFEIMNREFLKKGPDLRSDMNKDGEVNTQDYNLFLKEFGKKSPASVRDIYTIVENDDIYFWDDTGKNFKPLEQNNLKGLPLNSIAIAPNGDIYVTVAAGNIWRKPFGEDLFIKDSPVGNWNGITVAPNGDVYVARDISGAGDIYKKSAGKSSYLPLNQLNLNWNALCSDSSGNIYAAIWSFNFPEDNGGIYKQINGTGNFVPYATNIKGMFTGITVSKNGEMFVADYGYNLIYKKSPGSEFSKIGKVAGRKYTGASAFPNGDVYFSARSHWVESGDKIYVLKNGKSELEVFNNTIKHWNGISTAPETLK